MDKFFKKSILYNSKVSLMSEYLGTHGIVVKRVHCNTAQMKLKSSEKKRIR